MLPKSDQIHIWSVQPEEIKDNSLLQRYSLLLDGDEKRRLNKFYFEKDKHQFLITRALIRYVLSIYYPNMLPQEWTFTENIYGKPSAIGTSLHFNVSHSEKKILMAVANNPIGVDVEYIDRNINFLGVAKSVFTKDEMEQLDALCWKQQKQHFFCLWTLKEAITKALGLGMSLPLYQLALTFPSPNQILLSFDSRLKQDTHNWYLCAFDVGNQHKAAIAMTPPGNDQNIIFYQCLPGVHYQTAVLPITMSTVKDATVIAPRAS